jgi:hypothetical protein
VLDDPVDARDLVRVGREVFHFDHLPLLRGWPSLMCSAWLA